MGGAVSYVSEMSGAVSHLLSDNKGPQLEPVPIDRVLDLEDLEGRRQILTKLQRNGFVIVRETDEGVGIARGCRDKVGEFFDMPKEYKEKYELPPSSDPLLPQKKNRGYIPQVGLAILFNFLWVSMLCCVLHADLFTNVH